MNDNQVGFRLSLDNAEEFFRRCTLLKEDTREARIELMKDMQKEMKAIYMTNADLKRVFKNKKVLEIRSKGEN